MRVNISVPDDLATEARRLGLPVSAICQRALREEIGRRPGGRAADLAGRAREIAALLNAFATDAETARDAW